MIACPKCGSPFVDQIGSHTYLIALDDSVEVAQLLCASCDYEWDY